MFRDLGLEKPSQAEMGPQLVSLGPSPLGTRMRSKVPLAYGGARAAPQDLGTRELQVSAVAHGHGVCRAGFREHTGGAGAGAELPPGRLGLLGRSHQSHGRTRAES